MAEWGDRASRKNKGDNSSPSARLIFRRRDLDIDIIRGQWVSRVQTEERVRISDRIFRGFGRNAPDLGKSHYIQEGRPAGGGGDAKSGIVEIYQLGEAGDPTQKRRHMARAEVVVANGRNMGNITGPWAKTEPMLSRGGPGRHHVEWYIGWPQRRRFVSGLTIDLAK